MSIIASAQLDHAHTLCRVDDEFGFRRVKIERPAPIARLLQGSIDVDEHEQRLHERSELRPGRRASLEQSSVCERICQACRGAHHGRVETCRLQSALLRNDHVRREAETIDVRRERAKMIR